MVLKEILRQQVKYALQSSVMGGAVLNVTDVKKRPIGLFVIAVLHLFVFSGMVPIVLLRYNKSDIYNSVEKTLYCIPCKNKSDANHIKIESLMRMRFHQ